MYMLSMAGTLPIFHSCGKIVSDEPFLHAKRLNSDNLLIVGMEGTLHLQVGDEPVDVCPRDILIIPTRTPHQGLEASPGLSYFWCHYLYAEEARPVPDDVAGQLMTRIDAATPVTLLTPTHFAAPNAPRLFVFCQQMLDYAAKQEYLADSIIRYLLGALLNEIARQARYARAYTEQPEGVTLRFSQISEWVRINVYRNITVNQIGRHFNYNPNYLSNMFKQHTGMALKQYINHVRLDIAKEYLIMTSLPLREIAQRLSYSDEKYFMRLFKASEHMTPSEYRDSYARTVYYPHSSLRPSSQQDTQREIERAQQGADAPAEPMSALPSLPELAEPPISYMHAFAYACPACGQMAYAPRGAKLVCGACGAQMVQS